MGLSRWWATPSVEITGKVFIWISPQFKTSGGDRWDQAVHSRRNEWVKEELINVRERVHGIAGHAALRHLTMLQAVVTMSYA